MKKILLITLLIISASLAFAQSVLLTSASNPYVKYNFLTGDTLYFDNRSTGASMFYQTNTLRYYFGGINVARLASDGGFSLSDNTVFDQQLILNLSHNGVTQDGGINSTTYSATGFGNTFTGRLAGGTGLVPLVTPANAKLAEFTGKGYTGAAFSVSNRALIGFYTAQTFSLSNQGTRAIIKTTPVNSITLTNNMVFDETGSAGVTPNDTLLEVYPIGYSTTNARNFEITADGTGADVGLFMYNRSFTETIFLWHDNSANITYFDDGLDNAGSLTQFRARGLNATPVNVFSYTGAGLFGFNNKISLYNNAAPTDGQILIGNTAGGTLDAATLTAGGDVTITNGAGTITISNTQVGRISGNGSAATVTASTTAFGPIEGTSNYNATENNRQIVMPYAGTIKNFYVATSTLQPASGNMVITLRKNGASQTVTLTIAAGAAAGTFSDLVNSFTFVAGDLISIQFVNNGTAASAALIAWGVQVTK